ncbi:MAG: purine-nucleoside phosphorylase [Clostridiales bacterium]|nr:purine-nucleoside phosphorylase [Clostridiales bacterium]
MNEMERISRAAAVIENACGKADIAVVLGSGLGNYAANLPEERVIAEISYGDIPGFPRATVAGHAGKFVFANIAGKRVAFMCGRFHSYEGHPMADVVLPVRVLNRMGVNTLILTNAAGGVNTSFTPGTLMLIEDYLNLSGKNPLTGANIDELGPRFPDMSRVYTPALRQIALQAAGELGIPLRKGVYCMMSGPTYETPAEVRMVRILGADAVGMSTVPESIAAAHCSMEVLGISCITNMAAGVLDQPINHAEVMETGKRVEKEFSALMTRILEKIDIA